MPVDILMPALSPTMEKGNLAKWLVHEGDEVRSGDVIAEIETDKATMEVEAVDEGKIGKIVVPEGTADVAVNAVIAVLLAEGEEAGALDAPRPEGSAKAAAPASSSPAPEETGAKSAPAGSEPPPQPAAAAGPPPANPAAKAGANGSGRIVATPLARRIAKDAGIDLAAIAGSGPNGRIVKADIDAAASSGTAKKAPRPAADGAPAAARAPATIPAPPSDEQVLKLFEPGSYDLVPHDGMRRTIARRLTEAKQTIPHFYLTIDCDIDALLRLRAEINDSAPKGPKGEPAFKVSVNDFVIKALALALRQVPDANVAWTEGAMVRHKVVDVGVAVAIPGGLITPIVRRADEKRISAIATEMKDLAARARDRKLKPAEYQGGSTAVSNLGMFGIKDFAAVINPPQATILAVGAGEQRAVVRDGKLAVATVMSATLSTDHRAVDGVLGAELIQAFKAFIEKPTRMLV